MAPRYPRNLSAVRLGEGELDGNVHTYVEEWPVTIWPCPLPAARCPLPAAASRWNMGAAIRANAMVYVRLNGAATCARRTGVAPLGRKKASKKGTSSRFRSLVGAVGIVCGGGCRSAKASLRPVIVVLSPHQAEHNGRECAHSTASAISITVVSAAAELVCSACSRRLMYFQSASSI